MSRTRRKRRQERARNKFKAPRPRHRLKAGRTGSVHSKKTPPKKRAPYVSDEVRSIVESVICPTCGARPGEMHRHGALRFY